LVLALLGLSMCRLAALSDSSHVAAVADWVLASHRPEHAVASAEHPPEQISADPRGGRFRATG
jgi:hypothetical protein